MSGGTTSGQDTHLAPAEHVRCRRFDTDLVMVDLEGGEYFALDEVGGRMWDLLVSGKSPIQVGAILATEYEAGEDEIFRDCMKLADELVKRGLLVVRQR